jgi:hypothetical protein
MDDFAERIRQVVKEAQEAKYRPYQWWRKQTSEVNR